MVEPIVSQHNSELGLETRGWSCAIQRALADDAQEVVVVVVVPPSESVVVVVVVVPPSESV